MAVSLDHHPTSGEAICPYCGVGCRLWAEAAYGRVLRVKGVKDAPANLGRICAKGATLEQTVATADRLVQPMIRKRRGAELRPVSWDTVKPDECIAVAAAIVRVFIAHGDRTDRNKARLKYLLDDWGFDKFLSETENELSFPLRRYPLDRCSPRPPVGRQAHVDFHPQGQPGFHYVGVVLPVGRLTVEQMHALADIADRFGSGELRLTVWQNLLIPHIAQCDADDVKNALKAIGLDWQANSVRAGLVACTGSTGCKFAASNTKGQAMIMAEYLEQRIELDQPVNIHLTGCHHSCAQHYIGDIGLLATKVEIGDDMVEGYHVHVGGGYGDESEIGREIFPSVPFDDVPPLVERILAVYVERRERSDESFASFAKRHSQQQLVEMFEPLEATV